MQEAHPIPLESDIYSFLDPQKGQESIDYLSISDTEFKVPSQEKKEELMENFLNQCPLSSSLSFLLLENINIKKTTETDNPMSLKESKMGSKKKKTKKRRKSRVDDNSPFHNCQKHLIKALKSMLIFPEPDSELEEGYKRVARHIWNIFCRSNDKSKKVLHFIFNEDNEYKTSEAELRQFGLLEVYQDHGQYNYNCAKNYLSKLAIDQLDDTTISNYVSSTKIKTKLIFREYMMHFRQELVEGYLRRRIIPEALT